MENSDNRGERHIQHFHEVFTETEFSPSVVRSRGAVYYIVYKFVLSFGSADETIKYERQE